MMLREWGKGTLTRTAGRSWQNFWKVDMEASVEIQNEYNL